MPDVKVFVDTNVLLYAHDRNDPQKRSTTVQWLSALADRRAACINLQVLNELSYVLLRKKWFDSPGAVFSVVDEFAEFGDTSVGWVEIGLARQIHSITAYSWWDCLLLASALELGCSHFLSEDLQDPPHDRRLDDRRSFRPYAGPNSGFPLRTAPSWVSNAGSLGSPTSANRHCSTR